MEAEDLLVQSLKAWFRGTLGEHLLNCELSWLGEILPTMFGYHAVQVSPLVAVDYLEACQIPHKFAVHNVGKHYSLPTLAADPLGLPLETSSIDLVVLAHVLEFNRQPQYLLQEAERVLVSGGHMVIVGLNPWSMWGIRRLLRLQRSALPWQGRFWPLEQVRAWLRMAKLEIVNSGTYCFNPPIGKEAILKRTDFLENWGQRFLPFMGGAYTIVVKKEVAAMSTVKLPWRMKKGKKVKGVIKTINNRDSK